MKTITYWIITALAVASLISCSPTEKSAAADTLDITVDTAQGNTGPSPPPPYVSKLKVYWVEGPMYESDPMEPVNPFTITFDPSAKSLDTLAVRKALGQHVKFIHLDTVVRLGDVSRSIIRFKDSEICVYHYSLSDGVPTSFRTDVYSAQIHDKEIKLKNGLQLGMSKKECLAKYPFVSEPSDIVYISEKEYGYLRLEFNNDLLVNIEFWGNDNIDERFGSLQISKVSEVYAPIKGRIGTNYFDRLFGEKAIQVVDSTKFTKENSQGYPEEFYQYHYLISGKNSQFELIDFDGARKDLSLQTAYITTPLVKLTDGLKVGMAREDLEKHFQLPPDSKVVWINIPSGKLRFTLDATQVTSIEFGNGKVGRN